jgi:hypothetical protein
LRIRFFFFPSLFSAAVETHKFANRDNVVCVFVVASDVPTLQDKSKHHSNVILLTQHALEKCFGPTIMSAPAMSATCRRAAAIERDRATRAVEAARAELDRATAEAAATTETFRKLAANATKSAKETSKQAVDAAAAKVERATEAFEEAESDLQRAAPAAGARRGAPV